MSGTDAEDPEVELLRRSIRSHALSQPGTRLRVPIKWLKCELLIEKMVQKEHITHLSFKDFAAVASKVRRPYPPLLLLLGTCDRVLLLSSVLLFLIFFGNLAATVYLHVFEVECLQQP